MVNIEERLTKELDITLKQVQNVIKLLDEGNTVPFISRYRKEQTGGLSERRWFSCSIQEIKQKEFEIGGVSAWSSRCL